MTRLLIALLVAGSLVFPPGDGAVAQNVTLDEGTFSVSLAAGGAGTETFTVRRAGSGDDARVIAQGHIQWSLPSGARDVVPLLEVRGRALGVYAYQVEVSGDEREEIYLRAEGRRFVANVRSDAGEQQREFRFRPGSVILEEAVAHQYFLLAPALAAGAESVWVLTPRAGDVSRFLVTAEAGASVRVGSESLEATHVTLTSGDDRREVWLDGQGRVLRVEVPALDFVANRQDPPRG